MASRPEPTRIYHITHVDNLPSIVAAGGLLSDSAMRERGGPQSAIGMSSIKERRMRLPLKCHPGDTVGEYVPFYFCPRSIMLYLLHMGNHSELAYREGQRSIVHLQCDVDTVIDWATEHGVRWAFSFTNASATYASFSSAVDELDGIDWPAVRATDFRDRKTKDGKQAEFLVHDFFPWSAVERIGVRSADIRQKAEGALGDSQHRPSIDVLRHWYF